METTKTKSWLTEAQWKEYEKNGYLRLGKWLDDTELKILQQEIDAIMLGKARMDYGKILMQLDSKTGNYEDAGEQSKGFKGATLHYRKIQDLEFSRPFLEWMQHPGFREICARHYGAETPVTCFRAMFMNKPAGAGTLLPWHQDRWESLDRDPLVTIWTALDPATVENGCVEVIPGSHHRLINPDHPSGFLNAEQVAAHCSGKSEFLELKPGETVLLHNWLLHRSDKNHSNQSRRAFSVCYMDGRTRNKRHAEHFTTVFGEGALQADTLKI